MPKGRVVFTLRGDSVVQWIVTRGNSLSYMIARHPGRSLTTGVDGPVGAVDDNPGSGRRHNDGQQQL